MKCEFCGYSFNMDQSRKGCSGCPMSRSCGKLKCPNCNYEMYAEPQLRAFNIIKKWGKIIWKR